MHDNKTSYFIMLMDLPELRLQVGRYLSTDDLASCILVNKVWHETFLPCLYHKCNTDVIYLQQYWPAFKKNLQHTRELNILHDTLKTNDDRSTVLQKCTLLRKLSLNPAHLKEKFFLQLLQQNPRLRQVDLSIGEITEIYGDYPIVFNAKSVAVEILETIARSCPRLTELGLDMMLHPESEIHFYDSFSRHFMPRLTKLTWSWFRLNHMETLPWMIDRECLSVDNPSKALLTPPEFPELRDLTVYICIPEMPHPWDQELLLFENSPKLEVLSWSWDPTPLFGVIRYDPSSSIDLFIDILCKFIANRWLKLHSISLSLNKSFAYPFVFQDEHVSRVLKSLRNPLQRFELSNGNISTDLTWKALSKHLNTIHTLHINRETGTELSSSEIDCILTSGQNLIDFQHNSVLNASDITKNMTIDKEWPFCISSQYPWACHRLQVLKIAILRHPEDHSLNLTVFGQLARMRELRVLHISSTNRGSEYGLNPGQYVYDLSIAEQLPFDGLHCSYNQIRDHPVGKRLLLIWPGLTNCYWYNR